MPNKTNLVFEKWSPDFVATVKAENASASSEIIYTAVWKDDGSGNNQNTGGESGSGTEDSLLIPNTGVEGWMDDSSQAKVGWSFASLVGVVLTIVYLVRRKSKRS